jgi:cytochrome P450
VTEEAWNDIYKSRVGGEQLKKFIPQTPGWQHGLMDNPYDDEHAHCRKIFTSAINDRGVRNQEGLIQKNIATLIQRLDERCKRGESSAEVDIAKCLECVAFDIIGDFLSRETFDCL